MKRCTKQTDASLDRLAALILLVACGFIDGVQRIEGKKPEPTPEEWMMLLEGVKGTPEKIAVKAELGMSEAEWRALALEKIEEILSPCGGWPGVVAGAREVQRTAPDKWGVFRRYWRIKKAPMRLETVTGFAESLSYDRATIVRQVNALPKMVAYFALSGE